MSKTSSSTTHSETQIKLAQLQVERIKDEDEQWISGEELYTEGSSDDDDAALRAKRRYDERHARAPKKNVKSSSVKDKSDILEQKSSPAKQYVEASPAECVQSTTETVNTVGIANESKTFNSIVVVNETGAVCTTVEVDETGTMNPVGLAVDSQDCYDLQQPIPNDNDGCDIHVEADDSEISWRPKRGSIKLPNITVEGRVVELLTNSQM
ncbi:uncharacterized protein LOC126188127 isoform X2 [Schistocerca cancellata]|uniref:uncharacterized protein LOC126188127 isoform X2 n=1 Tax=Schistocerca cancellata TaxID=274614 RepID=UPI002117C572|nr:uncharacterized protein LOC126188127 isoform X2 [Schistocerca cancellata]